mmetsp:Transcript_19184/g.33044  ORF Transcript_19184/g.33044 Transcript_19184/m.33044 type:complete len:222 (+) Transcript_19184:703-1368(+)
MGMQFVPLTMQPDQSARQTRKTSGPGVGPCRSQRGWEARSGQAADLVLAVELQALAVHTLLRARAGRTAMRTRPGAADALPTATPLPAAAQAPPVPASISQRVRSPRRCPLPPSWNPRPQQRCRRWRNQQCLKSRSTLSEQLALVRRRCKRKELTRWRRAAVLHLLPLHRPSLPRHPSSPCLRLLLSGRHGHQSSPSPRIWRPSEQKGMQMKRTWQRQSKA